MNWGRLKACLIFSTGVLAIVVGASEVSAQNIKKLKAGAHQLTIPEVLKLLSGNTLGGKSDTGSEWFEYYDGNGTVRGMDTASGTYAGEWWADGDLFCTKWPAFNNEGCYAIWFNESANKVIWLDKKGKVFGVPGNVITGNPQGL